MADLTEDEAAELEHLNEGEPSPQSEGRPVFAIAVGAKCDTKPMVNAVVRALMRGWTKMIDIDTMEEGELCRIFIVTDVGMARIKELTDKRDRVVN